MERIDPSWLDTVEIDGEQVPKPLDINDPRYLYTNDHEGHDFTIEEVINLSAHEAAWLSGLEILDPKDFSKSP